MNSIGRDCDRGIHQDSVSALSIVQQRDLVRPILHDTTGTVACSMIISICRRASIALLPIGSRAGIQRFDVATVCQHRIGADVRKNVNPSFTEVLAANVNRIWQQIARVR